MPLNGISNYQNLYSSTSNKTGKTEKADKTQKNDKGKMPELSEAAKQYLQKLQKTYSNMDFMVAEYESDEEADNYMSQGRKEYSVLIEPEMLEKMANDSSEKAKFEDVLSNVDKQYKSLKSELGEDSDKIKSFGVSVDRNGIVSYFADMVSDSSEKSGDIKSKKEEEKKAAEKKEVKRIKAESFEKLLEKIRQAAAGDKVGSVRTDQERAIGQTFDVQA